MTSYSLIDKYPEIFKLAKEDSKFPISLFKLEVGPGWLPLIDELCSKLAGLDVTAVQVKEKFGGLRFYVTGASDEIYEVISSYEEKSLSVCEECSAPGSARSIKGYTVTLCRQCRIKREENGK